MKTLGTVSRRWAAVCALAVACDAGGGGEVTCGEGTEEVDGVCEVVHPSTGLGGATASGGSAGASGTSEGGTAGDGGTAGTDAGGTSGTDSGGTSGTDSGGTSGTDSGGTSGTDLGGAGGADSGGAGGAGGSTGGAGGSTGGAGGSTGSLCGSRDMTGATVVQGAITTDTTWSGLIRVAGDITVTNDATLTIEPGTKILVGWHHTIDFGGEDGGATLLAEGTAEAPILFCGAAERVGYWRSLALQQNVNPESILRHVIVADGGARVGDENPALVLHTPALIQHVQVVGAEDAGVETSGFGEGSEDLRVTECGYAGRVIDQAGIQWPANTDLNGNDDDIVVLAFSDISTSVTFENHGAAYLQTQNLSASSTTADPIVISFGPGVFYRIPKSVRADFDAVVKAQGTSEATPVRFTNTATCDQFSNTFICPYVCVGTNCYNGSGTVSFGSEETSSFERTVFDEVFVEVTGSAKFDEVEIEPRIVTVALSLNHGRLTSDSRGLIIASSDDAVIAVEGTCDSAALPADTQAGPEVRFEMSCDRFEADTVLQNLGLGYQFAGNVSITPDAHVTLEAGVRMAFSLDAYLHVEAGGALSIEGTASDPVVFTPGEAMPARWAGLRVESSDVDIDHADISYAAGIEWQGVRAAITTTVPISVSNTRIAHSHGYGIAHSADDDTDYTISNTFDASNVEADTVSF